MVEKAVVMWCLGTALITVVLLSWVRTNCVGGQVVYMSQGVNRTNQDFSRTNQGMSRTNQDVSRTNQDMSRTNQDVSRTKQQDEAGSPFRFASYFSDQVVLQRGPQRAWLWGYANMTDIGKNVTVTVMSADTSVVTTVVSVERGPFQNVSIWRVLLRPVTVTTAHIIEVKLAPYPSITLTDVYFGDVWLCSGQSNMQFSIPQMFGHQGEEAVAHLYDKIRMLNVQRVTSDVPLYDLKSIITPWAPPSVLLQQRDNPKGGWEGFSAVCYMYGKHLYEELGYPIGLIDSTWGGTPVEAWSDPPALAKCGLDKKNKDYIKAEEEIRRLHDVYVPMKNSLLWNAMIHPFINMTIKGTIWYQGEANANYHTNDYNCSFPTMINSWRANFHTGTKTQVPVDFPFGFVQIGPYDNPDLDFQYAMVRWHQMGDMASGLPLPNTFMAVAMDLADPISPYGAVHIRDKKTVAKRLSHAAINIVYKNGSNLATFPFPTHESFNVSGHQLLIEFSYGKAQINVRSLHGFEVCCAGRYSQCPLDSTKNWVDAPIVKYNVSTVWLSLDDCAWNTIAAYRYAWRETPCDYHRCAIYSDYSGDPLPTFTKPLNNL